MFSELGMRRYILCIFFALIACNNPKHPLRVYESLTKHFLSSDLTTSPVLFLHPSHSTSCILTAAGALGRAWILFHGDRRASLCSRLLVLECPPDAQT